MNAKSDKHGFGIDKKILPDEIYKDKWVVIFTNGNTASGKVISTKEGHYQLLPYQTRKYTEDGSFKSFLEENGLPEYIDGAHVNRIAPTTRESIEGCSNRENFEAEKTFLESILKNEKNQLELKKLREHLAKYQTPEFNNGAGI